MPGAVRQEGHLGRREAIAQDVVEVEILQLVGTDEVLGALAGLAVRGARHQFRADLGFEDVDQHFRLLQFQRARFGHPAHQVGDQVLGTLALTL
jgi:hypothetical protein